MSSPMFPSYPGTPQDERVLTEALTNEQVQGYLRDMNFTIVQAATEVPRLVDDLIRGSPDTSHPIHFLDILWDRDYSNPQPSAIIIYRNASVIDLELSTPVETRGWFIDTLQLPSHFMSICGINAATTNISLADVFVSMRWMCYDANFLCAGFRACHHLNYFNDIQDFQPFAALLAQPNAEDVAAVEESDSYLDVLNIMARQGRPVTWNIDRLEAAQAGVTDNLRAEIMQRPLSHNVVYRHVYGIQFLADMYRWYLDLYSRRLLSNDDIQIAIDRSRVSAITGYTFADTYDQSGMQYQGTAIPRPGL